MVENNKGFYVMIGDVSNTRIMRVFPRKTTATPDDELTCIGSPDDMECSRQDWDEVHISTLFTYDIPVAEMLFKEWSATCSIVRLGGPAFGDSGCEFTPGMYVKQPYVVTSRGCPNNCWFCDVWKREGGIRELEIKDGSNVLDSNLLACSPEHIKAVFEMLEHQPGSPQFTGGLEAARLEKWHVKLLKKVKTSQMFFAYDTPDDFEPLKKAGELLRLANFTRSHLRCYVLIGGPNDTTKKAERRLLQAWECGFMPMAMLWKNKAGDEDKEWRRFQRNWARPAITKRVAVERFFMSKSNFI